MSAMRRESHESLVAETTPLLPREDAKDLKWGKSILHRAFLYAFVVSLSFGVTQVPLLYIFRVMTCDAYYKNHSVPTSKLPADRCAIPEIEASTAAAIALLACSTMLFGLMNLLITGWTIKRYGVKTALLIQVFWPGVRLAVQNIGVMRSGSVGILVVQCSQILTVIGGPSGYVLTLNSLVTDVAPHEERTGAIGRLQGCMLVGAAVGFLVGGLMGDAFGNLAPFQITLILFLLSFVYIAISLPSIPLEKDTAARQMSTGITRFVGPFRIFAPQKWILPDGRSSTQYGALTLGCGVFLAILATGYIPTLLQIYSTNTFDFGTKENGWLIFLYSSLRGLYLTFVFPSIISYGRKWMRSGNTKVSKKTLQEEESFICEPPVSPNEIGPLDPMENDAEVTNLAPRTSEETYEFDLLYARFSLILDGILTGCAVFVTQGWQMYLLAMLLPLAAGTGSASKGTMLQMIPSSERVDALAGITLVENIARLSTTALFGIAFAILSRVGKGWAVFGCNAAVALVGFAVLCLSRFPPEGSRRADDQMDEPGEEERTASI